MIIEVYEDDLTKNDLSDVQFRSSRAIILKDDQVLMLYSNKYDFYMLPGGRIESDETPKDCVIREVLEETGFHVNVIKKTVVINEHYRNSNWNTHIFICEIINKKREKINLTDEEIDFDIEMVWKPYLDALTLLDTHDSHFSKGHNIMQREFLALVNSL